VTYRLLAWTSVVARCAVALAATPAPVVVLHCTRGLEISAPLNLRALIVDHRFERAVLVFR
jgi:hypothetical protein